MGPLELLIPSPGTRSPKFIGVGRDNIITYVNNASEVKEILST
jgi:hypothetical protein